MGVFSNQRNALISFGGWRFLINAIDLFVVTDPSNVAVSESKLVILDGSNVFVIARHLPDDAV